MGHDLARVTENGAAFGLPQVGDLFDQVVEVELIEAAFRQQSGLQVRPGAEVSLVESGPGRASDRVRHGMAPQCATAAAPCSSTSSPLEKRSRVKGALIGCGSPLATVWAKT